MIAIDLGSNTVRAIKYDCKSFAVMDSFEKIVKAADGTHKSGLISDEAKMRIKAALSEIVAKFSDENERVAVATAVYRKAKNAPEFLAEIESEFGIRTNIIDGEKEALLTAFAVETALKRLKVDSDSFLIVDIGGGSTEIGFKKADRFTVESFDVGIIAAAQKYRGEGALERGIKKDCKELKEFIKDTMYAFIKPQLFCATAGTPTTLAALKLGLDYASYDAHKVTGQILTLDDVDKLFARLLKSSENERTRLVGAGREELIIAGILIFKEVFEASGFRECVVVDDGLREGLALASCKKLNIF